MKTLIIITLLLTSTISAKNSDIYTHAKDVRLASLNKENEKNIKKDSNKKDIYSIAKIKKSVYSRK